MPVIRACGSCGQKNRVPGRHLANTGRCGSCKAALPPVAEPLAVDERCSRNRSECAGFRCSWIFGRTGAGLAGWRRRRLRGQRRRWLGKRWCSRWIRSRIRGLPGDFRFGGYLTLWSCLAAGGEAAGWGGWARGDGVVVEGGCAGFGLRLCRFRGLTDLAERQSPGSSTPRAGAQKASAGKSQPAPVGMIVAALCDPAENSGERW